MIEATEVATTTSTYDFVYGQLAISSRRT